MRVARQAARYRLQAEDAANRPYWMYDAINDRRTRAAHAALDNKVYRHDDPFWDTHYPPNGFNCRCRVRALTAQEVQARGLAVSDSRGKLHRVQQHVGVDKRTGEIITRPGMELRDGHIRMAPDAGWSYNPGKEGSGMQFDPDARAPVPTPLQNQPTTPGIVPRPLRPTTPGTILLPDTGSPDAQMKQFRDAIPPDMLETRGYTHSDGKVDVLFSGVQSPIEKVWLGERWLRHEILDHPRGHRERFANYVLPTLQKPGEIWRQWALTSDGQHVVLKHVYLAAYGDLPRRYKDSVLVAYIDNKYMTVAWTFYHKKNADKYRKGILLYEAE